MSRVFVFADSVYHILDSGFILRSWLFPIPAPKMINADCDLHGRLLDRCDHIVFGVVYFYSGKLAIQIASTALRYDLNHLILGSGL